MLWKVDSTIFPTSYPVPNLDTGKVVKSCLEVALRVQEVALRVHEVALREHVVRLWVGAAR